MGDFFKSQDYGIPILKHRTLPVYMAGQFNFYRCVEFNNNLYEKTVSQLHHGNLRISSGRYTRLFPGQKISYWADSPQTAKAEIEKHGANKDILTFWAYDDATSTFPTRFERLPLKIVDGRKCGIQELIDKIEENQAISSCEEKLRDSILAENPDCLVYDSHARKGGENYIFFERGFAKLSLREVTLRLGSRPSKNCKTITCALGSDYYPVLESYGNYFLPIAKEKEDPAYLSSDEYICRKKAYDFYWSPTQREIDRYEQGIHLQ